MTAGLDLNRIRAVLFDIDGTLADTDDTYVRRIAHALRPFRRLFRGEDPTHFSRKLVMFAETPFNTLLTLIDRFHIDEILALLPKRKGRSLEKARSRNDILLPGALPALQQIASRYPIAIVTSRQDEKALRFLRQFQMEDLFRAVVSARTCRRTKPHPQPVRWAAEQLGVAPEDCLMVGDTEVDIRSGVSAGAQAVGVLCGFGSRRELERAGANLILENTAQLAAVLIDGCDDFSNGIRM